MEKNTTTEIGIKYRVIPVRQHEFILLPIDVVKGYSIGDIFYSDQIYHTAINPEQLTQEDYLVDSIHNIEDLKTIYDYPETRFLVDYFFCEEQDYFLYLQIKDNKIISHKLNTKILSSENSKETYLKFQDQPSLILNEDALAKLLSITELEEIKKEIKRFNHSLAYFKALTESDAATKIIVKNGTISSIETNAKIIETPDIVVTKQKTQITSDPNISINGLVKYISERVFGHEEEIKLLATKIIMNYNSTPEFGTEPVLIVGPTGTGKTETIKAASEYLSVPFVEINTPDLVPQGIRGASLESYLNSLKTLCNGDLNRAEKAFVYLDEFDKLGKSDLDIKTSVQEILLKFLEGGPFIVDERLTSYTFNTTMLNKICSGAFQDLFETSKRIGFGATVQDDTKFSPKKITEAEYYGKELVTRISCIIPYLPLSREEQKRVIMESKISKYLQKKNRYKKQFDIDLILEDDFINGLLEQLADNDQSMRDLNNRLLEYLALPEYEILSDPHSYKKLILTHDTLDNPSKFKLM